MAAPASPRNGRKNRMLAADRTATVKNAGGNCAAPKAPPDSSRLVSSTAADTVTPADKANCWATE